MPTRLDRRRVRKRAKWIVLDRRLFRRHMQRRALSYNVFMHGAGSRLAVRVGRRYGWRWDRPW